MQACHRGISDSSVSCTKPRSSSQALIRSQACGVRKVGSRGEVVFVNESAEACECRKIEDRPAAGLRSRAARGCPVCRVGGRGDSVSEPVWGA